MENLVGIEMSGAGVGHILAGARKRRHRLGNPEVWGAGVHPLYLRL